MKNANYKFISLVIGLIAISGLAMFYAFAVWRELTAAPPLANRPAPINVSTTTQTFLGDKRLNFTTRTDVLSLGPGLGVDGVLRGYSNLIVDGNVGIGTTTPQTRLDVAGAIRVGSQDICNAANAGAIRFISTVGAERFEGCNGISWRLIASVNTRKRVFLTSTTHPGDFGGLAGADGICMTRASAAGLPGTWRALLSTSLVHARDRIGSDWDILVNMAGEVIARSKADLWDRSIGATINMTETGATITRALVWTGTRHDGTRALPTCADWTSNGSLLGRNADQPRTTIGWVGIYYLPCSSDLHLFCVEQ